ncbi:MAG: hypothetical protein HY657_01300 [Acidobacteria bacterium]|nr:hypothetical protein [Acidobacteriota bacterium]
MSGVLLAGQASRAGGALDIKVLSNRADLLSGGDALVEVMLPAGTDVSALRVRLAHGENGGHDVTSAFARRANGAVQGLVTGLPIGRSTLVASLEGRGAREVRIPLTNHPKGGPIFAGPQVQPWICMTEEAGLGPATDQQCNAPSRVEWFYKSSTPPPPQQGRQGGAAGGTLFKPYNPAAPPSDLAMTTTDEGKTVPYIVRREMGTIDRGIYVFAVLADPTAPAPTPFNPPAAWNRKLYWTFGGGASPGHRQAAPGNVLLDTQLSRGFAVATSSLNTFGNSFNSVVTAESVMMLKEHIVETLGEIRYTISTGGSGGAMQQQLLANAYPGLLDGIEPSASFPDIWKNFREISDCYLMLRYFKEDAPQMWGDVTVRNAVMNNANEMPGTCEAWRNTRLTWGDPTVGCVPTGGRGGTAPDAPPAWIYNPATNSKGTRCTLQDYQAAIFGRRPDGFANRPYDNVGVQYGLRALHSGTITPEQFVDLNEKIGGLDIDLQWAPQRSVADAAALDIVYRTGQLNLGHQITIPVIDNRGCRNTEVHSCYHSYVTRARIQQSQPGAVNHVIFLSAPAGTAFLALDGWVAAVKADTSGDPLTAKVARHKPADVTDSCWIDGQRTTDMAACRAANPYFGNAHLGAGDTIEDDVLKCQLKPLRRADYGVTFTDAQWARLQAAFPGGVCDWAKPGVGHTAVVPWLSFADGPGGTPLGAPPRAN